MTILGKYELHEQLGRGGFGTVYRAVDITLNREVALKVLHPQLTIDLDFLERFQNEARLTASLDNSHIVPIYELAEADGRVFIAMKYLPGGSLKQRLEKDGAIPFDETLKIMKDVCAGLNTAHKKGLVHRDVKPANFLFDGEGKAVIGDFGLARAVQLSSSSAASSAAGGAGTPAYRAPELWNGKPSASPATDVYSLGCVLYEMLTGKVLFDGGTPEEFLIQHVLKGPKLLEHFPEGVPDGIRAVLEKSLIKDPKGRYQSVIDLENGVQDSFYDLKTGKHAGQDGPNDGDVPIGKKGKEKWPFRVLGIIISLIAVVGLVIWLSNQFRWELGNSSQSSEPASNQSELTIDFPTTTITPTITPTPMSIKAEDVVASQNPDIVQGKFNVAWVLAGSHDDGGWSQAHYEGIEYMRAQMPDVNTAYIENVPEGADSEQVYRSLARKGFDLIYGTSFGFMDPMETIAAEYPNITFVHISGYKSNGTNFGNLFGEMETMKYLAGMIGGARALKDGNPKLGYVATFPIPEELRLGNAFALGMRKTCPECTMDVRWINTWHDPVVEKDAATSLFNAGAQVVFTGADTPSNADVAEAKGKWGITYDWNGSCKVDHCLTTPYWNWGATYLRVTKAVKEGTYEVGWDYFDTDSGGLGLYGFMEGEELTMGMKDLDPAVIAEVKDLMAKALAGEFDRFDVFSGPIKDNKGNVVVPAGEKMEQADMDQFPPGAEGLECKYCMKWWAEGITAELPE